MQRHKSLWALFFVVLFGAIAGSAIGQALGTLVPLLAQGIAMGTPQPLGLDLYVIRFSLAVDFTLNLTGALGILVALFLYKR